MSVGSKQTAGAWPDEPGWQELMEEAEREDYISCAANTLEGKLAGSLAIRLQQEDRVRLKSMGNEPGIQVFQTYAYQASF